MTRFRSFPVFLLGVLLFAGCARDESYPYATETDEPAYQRGKALEKQGREQEALSEFLRIVAKRGDDAPESHLEVGLLYEQHVKDPIAAIYHYRKYLELRPNSPQADLVRQRIAACMRDFARTLPGQPFGGDTVQADLSDVVARLQKENEDLKAELAAARSAQSAATLHAETESSESPVEAVPVPAAAEPPVITRAPINESQPAAISARTPVTRAPGASAGQGRVHTVAKGDTLMNISQHYYNTRSKWRDIYNANRDVMKGENDLKIGMQLKIP